MEKQGPKQLESGIRSLEEKIIEHRNNIANPKIKFKDWDEFTTERKESEIRSWEKEIKNFIESIENRKKRLKELGDEQSNK